MAYKDKDKQREANKEQMRRARAKGNTEQGNTIQGNTECPRVTGEAWVSGGVTVTNERSDEPSKVTPKPERTAQGNIRVSKPGEMLVGDLPPKEQAMVVKALSPPKSKRGKDIKTFADLPPDVQETIRKLSTIDGKIDQRVKANRTAIAINYQHLFPDRYNSTGVA